MDIGTGLALFGSAKLVEKLLGPTSEYLGEGIKDFAQKRVQNVKKIFLSAEKKLGEKINEPGRVPPRILKAILQEGSFCEDELTAEYFGGVLASSRSEVERDDRGVGITNLISQLSSYQIRTHYIIYSTIKRLYDGTNKNIGLDKDSNTSGIFIHYDEYQNAMQFNEKERNGVTKFASHSIIGLVKESLVEDSRYGVGTLENIKSVFPNAPGDGLVVFPAPLGVELYLSAHGMPDLNIGDFLKHQVKFQGISSISLPENPIQVE